MELEIKLTVSITYDDDTQDPPLGTPTESQLLDSARSAVHEALQRGEEMGFNHALAEITSMSILEVGEPTRV